MSAATRAGLRQVSARALRSHWPSAAGVFLTMALAAVLVTASGVLIESGLRDDDPFSTTATVLPAMMGSFGGVAVMLAVFVVSSAFAASLRDRRREFALLRAVGATGRQVRSLVSTEVMAISLGAITVGGLGGVIAARALVPLLRSSGMVIEGFSVALSPWPLLATGGVLVPAAWIAGRLAAREMARLSPTSAVSASTADARSLGPARIASAWACVAVGVAATTTPVFVPGAVGGATGAFSAIMFITAVALAGPALVQRAAQWLAGRRVLQSHAASVLATANARGYSRRLTAAVVPLALLVSLGMVQTGVNRTALVAASQQLGDSIQAEWVWQGPADQAADARAQLVALPGVAAVAASTTGVVQVKTETSEDEPPFLEGLSWETGSILMLDDPAGVVDPGVISGDLAALSGPDTVAIASDVLTFPGFGVGDHIEIRWPDGSESNPLIVATYERGLGLGGIIAGPEVTESVEGVTLYVQSDPGVADAVAAEANEAGLALVAMDELVDAMSASEGADARLSAVLLLALLGFIGIAAGNALVIATRSRSGEFALLGRLGATRRQLRAMVSLEAALVGVGAVAVGAATALPGLAAAALAMVRGFSLGVDPVMAAWLAGVTVAIAFAGTAGARLRTPA